MEEEKEVRRCQRGNRENPKREIVTSAVANDGFENRRGNDFKSCGVDHFVDR